jgi:hypothetical protein
MLRTAYPQGGVNQSVDKGISRTEPDPGLLSVFSRARRDEACGMTGVAVEAQAASAVNLYKTYGAGHAIVRALDNVSVAFERGRFTAVMGPSGSGLLAHKTRLALTALAIVLGVTFISGTFVLTDTLNSTFSTLFTSVYSKIDFQVRGVAQFGSGSGATRNLLPDSLLPRVEAVPGVAAAAGNVEGYAQFIAHDGKPITSSIGMLRIGWDTNPQISNLHLIAGNPPTSDDDVVMDAATAKSYDFSVGHRVRIPGSGLKSPRRSPSPGSRSSVPPTTSPGRPWRRSRCRPRSAWPGRPGCSTSSA